MKQVLAVRVAKKAVGHIVSKRWWPTVPELFPRHVFKSKKAFDLGAMEDKKSIHRTSVHSHRRMVKSRESVIFEMYSALAHPKTADEACNLDWGPLECQCVASSGTVFGVL